MTDLTKSLLDAISIITNKTIDEASSDKTIKAVIKKVISTSEGKYLVGCDEGDSFYAYNQSGSKEIYQVNEQIYILVPKDDMSQKKFIIGRVKDDEENISFKKLTSFLLNDYITIGDNAIIENTYQEENVVHVNRMQPLCLNSHAINDFYYCYLHDPSIIENYNTVNYPSINIDEEMFFNSAKQAKALLLRAKFKADIDINNIGNYGIIVNIAFADETNPQIDDNGNITYPPKLIAYVLDTNKMTGNPMQFYDYNSQYVISEFDGEKYLYIDSIVAFSEGFVDVLTEPHDEDDDVNIYIDDLEIIALDEISAINGDYKLRLTTPRGNTIKSNKKNNLKIVATMTYLNQDITENTTFYWGIKDPTITFSSNDYNAKLGPGYRYINKNIRELELSYSELTAAENIYVCTAVYESDIILKTSVSLYNNNNKLNITIDSDQGTKFQFNEGNPTLTCLIDGKTSNYQDDYSDDAFKFVWSKEDEDFGVILLNKTKSQLEIEKQNELNECAENENHLSNLGRSSNQVLSYYSTQIAQVQDISYPNGLYKSKITCKLKNTNNYVTYSCSVYRANVYIGYASITLQNFKNIVNNNYYVTITNGDQVFQYDEAGISPASQKQQDPIEIFDLVAVFHSPQGAEVTPKKVRWIMPQGDTLINIPTLGLNTDPETGEKYYSNNIFPLSIKDTYNNTYNDNQITVIVTHVDGTEYRKTTNLLFTKIGEIGTNGTNTIVKINELGLVPTDEYLTMIKPFSEPAFYNARNEDNTLYILTNNAILEANLYINNTQILGHSAKWSLADGSKTQGYAYNVTTEDDTNNCKIRYYRNNKELDTRIVKVQTSLQGRYYYSFYGIPTIEYNSGYTYTNYPIKIMKDGTLRSILYDSNGNNPSYNENQGIHVELPNWSELGYLEWIVESGAQTTHNNQISISYDNPNILLSKSPKSKTGSKELKIDSKIEINQNYVLEIEDISKNCIENASTRIKNYINNFIVDIKEIVIDNLLTVEKKIELIQNRLFTFKEKAPSNSNVHIKTIYNTYIELLNKIEQEYQDCKNKNKIFTEIYNDIQSIWRSEWPNVIISERLFTKQSSHIINIQQLIKKYQDAYDDRSNNSDNAIPMPIRKNIFEDSFRLKIENLDNIYDAYITNTGLDSSQFDSILIEYTKVLIAYINILIDETNELYSVSSSENDIIKNKYNFIDNDWNNKIGENIYNIIDSSKGTIANIFDKVRDLYQLYQSYYIGVKRYQIAEDSEILNIWISVLKGKQFDLLNQIYIVPTENFNGLYMNNNVVGTAFIKDNNNNNIEIAKIYIPVIMTLNTYELASLNGWDGTNIEINNDHIITPQIGTGIKDSITNTFTGMVMGAINNNDANIDNFKIDKIDKIGLVGYSNGKQSIFIDSRTGKTIFGLPEDDTDISEGRIELNPGGVSKIGNWKIGSHFLYNIINGSYERRIDKYSRSSQDYKLLIPHDKHGIILSSDKPYIHIKGSVYENLNGINYDNKYNNINPGDSLELRLDPGDKSLFSIIQHTSGFGDEENNLFFGYGFTRSDNTIVVRDYVSNQNINKENIIEYGNGAEYYIYRLPIDSSTNKYKSFYKETNNCFSLSDSISINTVYYKSIELSNSLSENNFRRMTNPNPVFSIDNNNRILYFPDNIQWKNGIIGNSNDINWESITEQNVYESPMQVKLKYYDKIDESLNLDSSVLCKIKNTTNKNFYQIGFYCDYSLKTDSLNLDDSKFNYIQFYLVSNSSDTIDQAILKSDPIDIIYNDDNINQYIKLFSYNNQKLISQGEYLLKLCLHVDSYIIDCDYSCIVNYLQSNSNGTLQWSDWSYTNPRIALKNFSINQSTLSGLAKISDDYLCIETDLNEAIQGIALAKTCWENNVLKIIFYKEYYDLVNTNNNSLNQYAYIDVSQYNNINYKYVRTLIKTSVNSWFKNLPSGWVGGNLIKGVYSFIKGSINSNDFQKAINWKEIVRVGLDEDGRFFSGGFQTKEIYNQIGRISAFGKMADLYGQETRVQLQNDYYPIIKIFSQATSSSTSKVTYITQGKNDDGSISIRTAKNNNYIELVASKTSDEGTNLPPNKTNFIKIGYNTGIQFQVKNNDDNIVNKIELTKEDGLTMHIWKMSLATNKTWHQINGDYTRITTPYYVVSSLSKTANKDVFTSSLKENNTNGHYRIKATYNNNSNKDDLNTDPTIQLQVGENNSGIDIHYNKVQLRLNSKKYMNISSEANSGIYIDDMKLLFKTDGAIDLVSDNVLTLKSTKGKSSIIISNNIQIEGKSGIALTGATTINGTTTITGATTINGATTITGATTSEGAIHSKSYLYAYNNLYIGYNPKNRNESLDAAIARIYYKENSTLKYTQLSGINLYRLFNWYNNYRLAAAVNGNTLYLRNVVIATNPEGNPGSWNFSKLNGYSGTVTI